MKEENTKTLREGAKKNIDRLRNSGYLSKPEEQELQNYQIQLKRGTKLMGELRHMIPESVSDDMFDKLNDMIDEYKICTISQMKKAIKKYQGSESESEEEEEKQLTKAQKTALIKKIPDWTYTEKQIYKIVDAIREGVITRVSGFPTPTEKGEKVEVEFVKKTKKDSSSVGKGTKGGVREGAGRKPSDKPKPLRVIGGKKGRPATKTEAQKLAEKQKKALEKEAKQEAKRKPYFKADDPPKGFREASMKEAADAHKILLWGKNKADSKIVNSQFEKPFDHVKIIGEMAGLTGKLGRFKRELTQAKTSKEQLLKNDQLNEIKKLILAKMPEYHKALEISKEKTKKYAEAYEKKHGSA